MRIVNYYFKSASQPRFQEPKWEFCSCRLGEKNFTGTLDMHINREEFLNIRNLKELVNIKRSEMSDLPKHLFTDFPKLDFLYIKDITGLNPLRKEFFNGNASSITKLWIQKSTFRTIFRSTFENAPNIEHLCLPYTEIEVLEEGSLDDIPKLKGLFLKGNKIRFLYKSIFRNNKDLEELDFTDNKLESLDFSLLQNPKIINLLFEQNPVEMVDPMFFYKKTSLNYIGLKDNVCVNKEFDGVHGEVYKVKQGLEICFLNYKNLTNEVYLMMNELEAKIYENQGNNEGSSETVTILIILQTGVLLITIIGLCIYATLRNSDNF
jgi:Leucine-rich repeat (LRR) protein